MMESCEKNNKQVLVLDIIIENSVLSYATNRNIKYLFGDKIERHSAYDTIIN